MRRTCTLAMAVLLGLAAAAHAESVNLLTAVPTTVAVSSTVDNPQILPAHLVDGKLDTAWNSVTGELEGAWFGVKLPDDAVVDTIKLTVGFTHVDKRYGDLFAQNPRIAAVQITRDDREVARVELDPSLHTLQSIPVGALRGGTLVVHVTKVVAGSRAAWREVNVSELEVWGTPGASTRPGRYTPTIFVGSFTHTVATRAQCLAASPPPRGAKPTRVDVIELADDRAACVIERVGGAPKGSTTATITAIATGAKPRELARLPDLPLVRGEAIGDAQMPTEHRAALTLATYALTTHELALRVTTRTVESTQGYSNSHIHDELYRLTTRGLTQILDDHEADSNSMSGGRTCELRPVPALAAALPRTLPAHCRISHVAISTVNDDRHDHDWEKEVDHAWVWHGDHFELDDSDADFTAPPP